jgi:HK97 family phage prohead protease
MNKLLENLDFKVYTQAIIKAHTESNKRVIQGYASVGDVLDRQNEVITLGALVKAKDDLLRNPTIFFNHEHSSLPIGKTVAAEVDGNGLLITVEISKGSHADDIWTLIQEGSLDRFSIGGRVLEAEEKSDKFGNLFNEITKIELFETSVVGLPANPAAKFQVISKSISQSITDAKRRKGEQNPMSKENEEIKEETLEVVKSDDTSNEVETEEIAKEVVVEEAKEVKEVEKELEIEKTEELEAEETPEAKEEVAEEVETEEIAKVEEVAKETEVTLTKEERKAQLIKELEELDAEEEAEETSPEAETLVEKDTQTLLLESVNKLVQLLVNKEEGTEEVEAAVEKEVDAEETIEVSKEVESEEVVEKEVTRKSQVAINVAEHPYTVKDGENTVSDSDLEKATEILNVKCWDAIIYGKKTA